MALVTRDHKELIRTNKLQNSLTSLLSLLSHSKASEFLENAVLPQLLHLSQLSVSLILLDMMFKYQMDSNLAIWSQLELTPKTLYLFLNPKEKEYKNLRPISLWKTLIQLLTCVALILTGKLTSTSPSLQVLLKLKHITCGNHHQILLIERLELM